MKQVFISYSTKDQLQAEAVRNVIEQNGITCWMAPRDIPGGSNYTKEIPHAIRDCQAFVLMLSQNAQNSPWVLKELDRAVNEGKIILPFQLEDITLNDEFNFLLTGAQRYDAYQKKSEALQLLISRIKAIIDPAPQTDAAPRQEEAPKKETVNFDTFQSVFSSATVRTEPKKTRNETFSDGFGTAVCPACGSLEVTRLKGKIKARDIQELLIRVLCVAVSFTVIPTVVAMIFTVIGVTTDLFMNDFFEMLLILLTLASSVASIWLGFKLSGEWIRRRRVRSHKAVEEFRCNICRKQFLPENKS